MNPVPTTDATPPLDLRHELGRIRAEELLWLLLDIGVGNQDVAGELVELFEADRVVEGLSSFTQLPNTFRRLEAEILEEL